MTKLFFFLFSISTAILQGQTRYIDLDHFDNSLLNVLFEENDVVVIGELHGTMEVPNVIYRMAETLSKTKKPFTVALEQPSDMQDEIDEFMSTGVAERLLSHDYFDMADGRSSKAMLNLLTKLRKLKGVEIVCFDISPGLGDVDRDSVMGMNLATEFKTDKMILLTGNLHAQLELKAGSAIPKTAVYHFNTLRSAGDHIIILQTFYNGGTIWNCMKDGCKERSAYSNPGIDVPAGLKNFIAINDSARSGYIFFDRVTASTPAVESK